MLKIEEIKKIDKKHIALMDTSSISFMQSLQKKHIQNLRDTRKAIFTKKSRHQLLYW